MLKTYHFTSFFLKCKSNYLETKVFFLLNAAFAVTILDLISPAHIVSFVIMLSKELQNSAFSSSDFYHCRNIWRDVQITNRLNMQYLDCSVIYFSLVRQTQGHGNTPISFYTLLSCTNNFSIRRYITSATYSVDI